MPDTTYPKTVTPLEAEAFFRHRANFAKLNVEQIYQLLGYPDDWADWDLGRVCCAWSDAAQTVRIYTDSRGFVDYVELIKPRTFLWFGGSKEVLWAARQYSVKPT